MDEVLLNDWRHLRPITCMYEFLCPIKGLVTKLGCLLPRIFFFSSVVESPGKKTVTRPRTPTLVAAVFFPPLTLFWAEWNVTYSVVPEPADAAVGAQSRRSGGTCSLRRLRHWRRGRVPVAREREDIRRLESSDASPQEARWERVLHQRWRTEWCR